MSSITTLDWSSHTHIGLDLDETLAPTMEGFLRHAHHLGDLIWIKSLDDITSHDETGFGDQVSRERIMELWELYGKSTMDPVSVDVMPGVHIVLELLRGQGKSLSIITARSDRESWKTERTNAWIRHHLQVIGDDAVHFVNHFSTETRPKSVPCQEIGVTLMIEDALENCIELCENGISSILLEKPWNRHKHYEHPLLYRVKDWNEIRSSLLHHATRST